MAVPLFLIHGLSSNFRILAKGFLISFTKDHVLIFIILFKNKIQWTALVDSSLNVHLIFLVDAQRYRINDHICISTFTYVLSFQVADDHFDMKSVVDSTGCCQVNSFEGDILLLSIVQSWLF